MRELLSISDVHGQGLYSQPTSWTFGFILQFKYSGHVKTLNFLAALWFPKYRSHHAKLSAYIKLPCIKFHLQIFGKTQTETNGP